METKDLACVIRLRHQLIGEEQMQYGVHITVADYHEWRRKPHSTYAFPGDGSLYRTYAKVTMPVIKGPELQPKKTDSSGISLAFALSPGANIRHQFLVLQAHQAEGPNLHRTWLVSSLCQQEA